MFDWFNLADRLMVGVPVMLGAIACVLLMCRAEERARKAKARRRVR